MTFKVYSPSQWAPKLTGYYSLGVAGELFEVENADQAWSLSSTDNDAIRFELRPGDHAAWDVSAAGHGAERTEIADRGTILDGTPLDVSYAFSVEPGAPNTASWLVLGQLHPGDSFTAPKIVGPPFNISLSGEVMLINVVIPDANGNPVVSTLYTDTQPIVRGHFYDMDIKAVFDPGGAGRLVVVRDGVTLVDYSGPLGYANQTGVTWHEGIYRSPDAGETIAATFKDLEISSGSSVVLPDPSEFIAAPALSVASLAAGTGNAYRAVLTGSAKPSTRVSVFEGKTLLGSAMADGQGRVSLTVSVSGAGEHLLSSIAVDATGRSGISSIGMALEIGTVADIVSRMAAIAVQPDLDAILLTDSSVLSVASTGQMYNFIKVDAAALAKIQGPYSFQVTTAVKGQAYDTQVELYTASGTLTERMRYARGALTFDDQIAADGSQTIRIRGANGQWSVSTVAADGFRTAYATLWPDGTTASSQTFNRDGSTSIASYDPTGRETSLRLIKADKSVVAVTLGITGQPYAILSSSYAPSGTLVSQQRYTAAGVLVWSLQPNADGSTTTANYDPATGQEVSYITTLPDGTSVQGKFGITGQPYTAQVVTLSKTGAVLSKTTSNAVGPTPPPSQFILGLIGGSPGTGATKTSTQQNADGSTVVSTYQPGSSTLLAGVQSYDPAGKLVESDAYDTSGRLSTVDLYDGLGRKKTDVAYAADGTRTTTSFDPGSGTVLQVLTLRPDGSRRVENDAVAGKPYATQSTDYDADGQVVGLTRTYGDAARTVAMTEVINPDGSTLVRSFDTQGREVSRRATAADGSSDVANSTYSGASTTPSAVQTYHFAAPPVRTSNMIVVVGATQRDAIVAGDDAALPAAGNDVLDPSAAAPFVFTPAQGQIMPTSVDAAPGAANPGAFPPPPDGDGGSRDTLAQALQPVDRGAVVTAGLAGAASVREDALVRYAKGDHAT